MDSLIRQILLTVLALVIVAILIIFLPRRGREKITGVNDPTIKRCSN